ncbi:CRISPR-associated protein (Cas_Csn2) [Eubacterium ruminantium]|nr:CRISPR-associated protein (Cas_Csn2) [Eubacterium ruminantium]
MKLVNINMGIDIDFEENDIIELIIENSKAFADTVFSIAKQCNGDEGEFVLSDSGGVLKLNKYTDVIFDYFTLSTNNKKILAKLYTYLSEITNQYIEEKADINSKIVAILDSITTSSGDVEIKYNLDFNWADIFKLYNVEFEEDYADLLSKLISYVKIISSYSDINTLFLVNVRSYLSSEELVSLYEMTKYCKVNIILIESRESIERTIEKRYIIDKDLCFINAN